MFLGLDLSGDANDHPRLLVCASAYFFTRLCFPGRDCSSMEWLVKMSSTAVFKKIALGAPAFVLLFLLGQAENLAFADHAGHEDEGAEEPAAEPVLDVEEEDCFSGWKSWREMDFRASATEQGAKDLLRQIADGVRELGALRDHF